MPYVYNPLTGQLDFVNPPPSGGATTYTPSVPGDWSPVPATVGGALDQLAANSSTSKYSATFNNTSSWNLVSGDYEYSVTYATHGKGPTPTVTVYEDVSGTYKLVTVAVEVDSSGNVKIKASGTPDLRFAGRIVIE